MKENSELASLIENLKKAERPIWKRVAHDLSKPRRKKVQVNVSKIEQYAKGDNILLIPGKVLGSGGLTKKVTVAAYAFSETAKSLITKAGGKTITIGDLQRSNPQGKGITLMR